MQGKAVVVSNKIDGNAQMSKSSRPTNPVQVGLGHFGEVEVDDHVDGLNIDTTGQQVGTHQVPAQSCSEIMENAVPVGLSHPGVNVVATVSQISDFLSQQLDSLRGVAKNDALINLKKKGENI